ncbi:pyridoxal phosphate-dependent transferase [Dipodascopsis tothii]|uniref:pyridoxal phosphate-dependent transferase n=1 Tax=Dipodascopsis tothii TaxID=44089 RepID=UPI0034CFA006
MSPPNLTSPAFDLASACRPNILRLKPYRCARDDYKTGVLLDANENAYGPSLGAGVDGLTPELLGGLNRYPDPHQIELKQEICALRNETAALPPLTPANLYVGVGSDECVDTALRCFAKPGFNKLLTCPPTYGMYAVAADVNDVEVVAVPLDTARPGFPLRVDAILDALTADPSISLVYICSPGNPTAATIDPEDVKRVLAHPTWNGIVAVDEAYIDFSPAGSSMAQYVNVYDNLIVMQTLSKAFGMAGIRLGVTYAAPAVATIFNAVKAPYNISSMTAELAKQAVTGAGLATMRKHRDLIVAQRDRLIAELPTIPGIGKDIGGHDANFLLYQILDRAGQPSNTVAEALYTRLAETKGVVVRFRGKEYGCLGALRITVGTADENDVLVAKLRETLAEINAE